MLEDTLKMEVKEKQEFKPIPEDVYQVEFLDVKSRQAKAYNDPSREETVLDFQFVLLEGKDGVEELRGRNVWRNFVPTYFYEGNKGKNVAIQISEALLGRVLTDEEEATWDGAKWNSLIGTQLRVVIENTTKDTKTYSNIKSFLPKRQDLAPLTAEEKEKATVKKEVNPNNIDIPKFKEEQSEEINIEDIPF